MRRASVRLAVALFSTAPIALFAGPTGPKAVLADSCAHCDSSGEAFEEFLIARDVAQLEKAHSTVHILWPTHLENLSLTSDNGGWESPSLHQRLAEEAKRGFQEFNDVVLPTLPSDHDASEQAANSDDANAAFYAWQQALFAAGGNITRAKLGRGALAGEAAVPGGSGTTWPALEALPEYARIRELVDKLSRRYLERSGIEAAKAQSLTSSIFAWAGVYGPGDHQEMRTFPGNYHVATFYARAGPWSGKLRFHDPRGHSAPFGNELLHAPRSGDLLIYPAWLGQGFTVTPAWAKATTDSEDETTVVLGFHMRPASGSMASESWWSDPVADMRFSRPALIDARLFKI